MKLLSALALSLFAFSAVAANAPIEIQNPQIYIPLKGTPATAGYGTIRNTSDKQVLITIKSANGFKAVEMHETISKNGVASMKKLSEVKLPAKTNLEMAPGSNHIMLFNNTREFQEGDETDIIFNVDGKPMTVKFKLVARPTGAGHEHHGH